MGDPRVRPFTAEDKTAARELWLKGLSGTEITNADPRFAGRTRNSILGLIHRLGLMKMGGSDRPSNPRFRPPRLAAPKPARKLLPRPGKSAPPPPRDRLANGKPAPLAIVAHPAGATSLLLLQLNDRVCKFAVGPATGADQLFCGAPTDGSWCADHAPIVFAAPPPPNRRGDADRLLRGLLSDRRRETTL